MAKAKIETTTQDQKKAVVVTTEHRGVFFGYLHDCNRLHGLCGCGGTPRPRRCTCTRCAARGRTAPRVSTAALLEAVLLHAHLLPAPLVEQVRAALERVR